MIVQTVLVLAEKLRDKSYFLSQPVCIFPRVKNLHTRKTSNGSNFGWLIRQMSINQKSGRQTFRKRFVSGSLFVSPCPPECNFQSETKIEPDLRLFLTATTSLNSPPLGFQKMFMLTLIDFAACTDVVVCVYTMLFGKQVRCWMKTLMCVAFLLR